METRKYPLALKVRNHYIPRTYLKRWLRSVEGRNKRVLFTYNLLSEKFSESGANCSFAKEDLLYVHREGDEFSDEIENWFSQGESAFGEFMRGIEHDCYDYFLRDSKKCHDLLQSLVGLSYRDGQKIQDIKGQYFGDFLGLSEDEVHREALQEMRKRIVLLKGTFTPATLLLLKNESQSLFTCERPFMELNVPEGSPPMAMIPLSPQLLGVLVQSPSQENDVPLKVLTESSGFDHLFTYVNTLVLSRAKHWIVWAPGEEQKVASLLTGIQESVL